MLWSDARSFWDGRTLPDPRVTHYWDGDRRIGRWFAQNVDRYEGVSWDAYYLYGANAQWDEVPTGLVASGSTVYSERSFLGTRVDSLLR
jgi:hypothetical protein